MRVIAGEFRSRVLKTLPGQKTRPTPDRLRESLFSILAPRIAGTEFVDAYAGSGAVGIEALSRGAKKVFFIESSRAAVEILRDNLHALGIENRAEVFTSKAVRVIERLSADILFLDPPYESEAEYESALMATKAPLALAQHSSRFALNEEYGPLRRFRILKQGDNSISFFQAVEALGIPRNPNGVA